MPAGSNKHHLLIKECTNTERSEARATKMWLFQTRFGGNRFGLAGVESLFDRVI